MILGISTGNDGDHRPAGFRVSAKHDMTEMPWGDESKIVRGVDVNAFVISTAPHIRADILPTCEPFAKGVHIGSATLEGREPDRPNVIRFKFAVQFDAALAGVAARINWHFAAVFAHWRQWRGRKTVIIIEAHFAFSFLARKLRTRRFKSEDTLSPSLAAWMRSDLCASAEILVPTYLVFMGHQSSRRFPIRQNIILFFAFFISVLLCGPMSTTNKRPTPETDAASFNVYAEWLGRKKLMESDIVEADFARKLERERDEAVAYAERCKQGCISLSHAIDRIDYACGDPNEMGVSDYCVHQNEELVIERVKDMLEKLKTMREALKDVSGAPETVSTLPIARMYPDGPCLELVDHNEVSLRAIEAHLDRLLAIAAKRTPGEWFTSGSKNEVIGNNEYGFISKEEVCCSPKRNQFWPENATFIALCANNAEAGWRSAKAAIADWLSLYNSTEGYADGAPDASAHDKLCNEVASICRINLRHILAEWPLETLKP